MFNVDFFTNYALGSRGSDIFVSGGNVSWVGGSSVGMGGELSLANNIGATTDGSGNPLYQTSSGGSVGLSAAGKITIDDVAFSGARVYFGGGAVMGQDAGTSVVMTNCYINDTAGLRTGAVAVVKV